LLLDVPALVAGKSLKRPKPAARHWRAGAAAITLAATVALALGTFADVGFEVGIVPLWIVPHKPAIHTARRVVGENAAYQSCSRHRITFEQITLPSGSTCSIFMLLLSSLPWAMAMM
jgi:hypothetical protein